MLRGRARRPFLSVAASFSSRLVLPARRGTSTDSRAYTTCICLSRAPAIESKLAGTKTFVAPASCRLARGILPPGAGRMPARQPAGRRRYKRQHMASTTTSISPRTRFGMARVLLFLLIAVLLVALGALAWFYSIARSALPQLDGSLKFLASPQRSRSFATGTAYLRSGPQISTTSFLLRGTSQRRTVCGRWT